MGHSHWIDPERIFDSVVVMTDDAIYVCNPPEERAKEIAAALDAGQPPSQVVMKDDPTTILIGGITLVKYDQKDDDVAFAFKLGKEESSKNIAFSSREERDAFMIELAERMPECDSKTVEWGPVRASLGPLVFGGVVGFMTWAMHGAASALAAGADAEVSGRRAGLKKLVMWMIELVGPTGVLVGGGLVLALTGVFLWKRITTPPVWTTLTPRR